MVHPRRLVASAAAVGLVAILSMGTPTAASVNPGNPVAGGRGFLVLVADTAVLTGSEMDGSLAVGGDVAIGGAFNVATRAAGTFTAPGDNVPSALVVGGKVNFAQSTQGAILRVLHGYAKVGHLAGTFVRGPDTNRAGANTLILPADDDEAKPRVELAVPQAPVSVGPSSPVPFDQIFADYKYRSRQLATCPNTVVLRDSRDAPITRSPIPAATNARVALRPGRTNVLNIKSTDLNNIATLTFANQPTASSPLLINVDTSDLEGNFGWTSPAFAGIGGEQARFVLVNFPGARYLSHASGGNVEATIFAPQAEFVDDNPSSIDGNIVARELYMTSGEVHSFPFSANLTCLLPAPSPSISPSASPSASLTASPSASVSAYPGESEGSGSEPQSAALNEPPSDFVGGARASITGVPLTLIVAGGSLLIVVGSVLLWAALRRE